MVPPSWMYSWATSLPATVPLLVIFAVTWTVPAVPMLADARCRSESANVV